MVQETRDQWLDRMTSRLKPYPSYKSEFKAEYQELFKKLAMEFGREQADRGINRAINDENRENKTFHPSPGEFREYVIRAKDSKALWGAAKSDCHFCAGDGWMTDPRKPGYVTKCDCRRLA